MSIYLREIRSPFGLAEPSETWLRPIEAYDRDLRIFPSQLHPYFRLARLAHRGGGLNQRLFARLPNLHPDTKICLDHKLVAVTTILPVALTADPWRIVDQLRRRDLWSFGGTDRPEGADVVADKLEEAEAAAETDIDQRTTAGVRERVRAMRIGALYRTGARVSLVNPLRPHQPGEMLNSPVNPGGPDVPAATASPDGGT